jgi:hypothetical protein
MREGPIMSAPEISDSQRLNRRVLTYAAALLGPAAILLVVWPKLVTNLFASGFGEQMFMPHGMCYLWVPQLYVMHVSSDLLIGVSYVAISSTLIYLIYRARHDMPFSWIFLAFGVFIFSCSITHFMEVDDLACDLLALGVHQTPDRSVFGATAILSSFPKL